MGTMILGYQNNVLAATLAASTSVAGLGPDQLQNDQGNAATGWQTTSATAQSLTVTMPGAVTWRAFGLFRTNLTGAATVSWQVDGGATYTSPALVPGFGQAVYVVAADITGTQLHVNISDPTNPDGYLNVPLIYAGPAFQPARNYDFGSSPGRANQTTTATLRAGGTIARTDFTRRTFDLSLSSIRAADMQAFDAVDLFARGGGNLLFVPNPGSATLNREALFGQLAPASGFTYPQKSADARGWRATISERL